VDPRQGATALAAALKDMRNLQVHLTFLLCVSYLFYLLLTAQKCRTWMYQDAILIPQVTL
jgi:hypothetical protein